MTDQTQTPFSQQIAFLGRGSTDAEVTEALVQVVRAVRETRKAGHVTLKLAIRMADKRTEDAIRITPQITKKVPELESEETIMYSTYDGDLLRDDPRQEKLDLRDVSAQFKAPAPAKEVAPTAQMKAVAPTEQAAPKIVGQQ